MTVTSMLSRVGPRRHRRRWVQPRWLILAVGIAGIAFLIFSVVGAQLGERDAETTTGVVAGQRDAAAAQAASFARDVRNACDLGELDGPVCQRATEVATDPIPGPAGPIGPAGPAGPGPTAEQIQAAVAAELAANPPPAGRPPTAAEVAAAAAEYLTANPPSPGRPPTAAEIGDAVTAYFVANPAPPGRAPTAEEIREAVAAELAANPPPAGPPGMQGAQGVGVSDIRAEDRDDGCVLIFDLVDPSDGSISQKTVPVGDSLCGSGGIFGG